MNHTRNHYEQEIIGRLLAMSDEAIPPDIDRLLNELKIAVRRDELTKHRRSGSRLRFLSWQFAARHPLRAARMLAREWMLARDVRKLKAEHPMLAAPARITTAYPSSSWGRRQKAAYENYRAACGVRA